MPGPLTARAKFFAIRELRETVFVQLPFPTIVNFAKSSGTHHEGVAILYHARLHTVAQRFVNDPNGFMNVLVNARGVISGSTALCIVFAKETQGWEAGDLDIYVPHGNVQIIASFLSHMGYISTANHQLSTKSYGTICTVITFCKNDRKVDVIESDNSSAVAPIFEFHLTALMNYVTPYSVFSAYPALTSQQRAIVNPMLFHHGRFAIHTCFSMAKYAQRGFRILSTSQAYMVEHQHKCGRAAACAVTPRDTKDEHRMVITLERGCSYTDEIVVEWCLGGRLCNLMVGYQTPVITVRDNLQ